jgi:hypothetical protein
MRVWFAPSYPAYLCRAAALLGETGGILAVSPPAEPLAVADFMRITRLGYFAARTY